MLTKAKTVYRETIPEGIHTILYVKHFHSISFKKGHTPDVQATEVQHVTRKGNLILYISKTTLK